MSNGPICIEIIFSNAQKYRWEFRTYEISGYISICVTYIHIVFISKYSIKIVTTKKETLSQTVLFETMMSHIFINILMTLDLQDLITNY